MFLFHSTALSQSFLGLNVGALRLDGIYGLNQSVSYSRRVLDAAKHKVNFTFDAGITQSLNSSQQFGKFPFNLGAGVSFSFSKRIRGGAKFNIYKFDRLFDILNFQGGLVACHYNNIKALSIFAQYNILKDRKVRKLEPYCFMSIDCYKRGGITRDPEHFKLKESCSNPISPMYLLGLGFSIAIERL